LGNPKPIGKDAKKGGDSNSPREGCSKRDIPGNRSGGKVYLPFPHTRKPNFTQGKKRISKKEVNSLNRGRIKRGRTLSNISSPKTRKRAGSMSMIRSFEKRGREPGLTSYGRSLRCGIRREKKRRHWKETMHYSHLLRRNWKGSYVEILQKEYKPCI